MDKDSEPKTRIRQLSAAQRRVIGVLMEKAFTTPEQYPLTLKALTSGCNQKSNRVPLTRYSEGDVQNTLDELRDLQLVAEVFTAGGRSARYRHYMRYRFDLSDSQFGIIAELWLRGAQQPGELRTRASRMVSIESRETLRGDLAGLQEKEFICSSEPLERRGVTVDHTFYPPDEAPAMTSVEVAETQETTSQQRNTATDVFAEQLTELQKIVMKQQQEITELREQVARLDKC